MRKKDQKNMSGVIEISQSGSHIESIDVPSDMELSRAILGTLQWVLTILEHSPGSSGLRMTFRHEDL